jgi:hypothetical protein
MSFDKKRFNEKRRLAARHGKLVWRDNPVLARKLYAPHDWLTEVDTLDKQADLFGPARSADPDRNSRNSEQER